MVQRGCRASQARAGECLLVPLAVAIAAPSLHQPRRRRDRLSELVQIDGSEHAWFKDRGPVCTLLAFVDDATSRLVTLRFVASESTFDYFRTTRAYLEAHGRLAAFQRVSQCGRALEALHIDIICANSDRRMVGVGVLR